MLVQTIVDFHLEWKDVSGKEFLERCKLVPILVNRYVRAMVRYFHEELVELSVPDIVNRLPEPLWASEWVKYLFQLASIGCVLFLGSLLLSAGQERLAHVGQMISA